MTTTHEQSETIDRNDPGLYAPGVIECACCDGSGVITIGRNADERGEFAEQGACDECDGWGVLFVETKPSDESWTIDAPHTAELVDGGAR